MSKEKYFKMEGKKEILFGRFDNTPQFLIKLKVPIYQHQFQSLVNEWKKPIDDSSDMDDFISWLNNKKKIICYCIPKIYYIENNKRKKSK